MSSLVGAPRGSFLGLLPDDVSSALVDVLVGANTDRAAAVPTGQSILRVVAWAASRTVDINAKAVADPPWAAVTMAAAAVWGWPGGGGRSPLLFLGTILLTIALLTAGLAVLVVSALALHGDQPPTPASALVSWAERRQHMLLWLALSLLVLTYTLVPLRIFSAAHFATPLASRAFTSMLDQ